jgi:hypothetical protein
MSVTLPRGPALLDASPDFSSVMPHQGYYPLVVVGGLMDGADFAAVIYWILRA